MNAILKSEERMIEEINALTRNAIHEGKVRREERVSHTSSCVPDQRRRDSTLM